MKRSLKWSLPAVLVGAVVVLVTAGAGARRPADARPGIDERGQVSETVATGIAPDILRGLLPEVVVAARVPARLRGELAEVLVRAEAPWTMSNVGEVRVAAGRPAGAVVAVAHAAGASRVN